VTAYPNGTNPVDLMVVSFDSAGVIDSITDASGNAVTLAEPLDLGDGRFVEAITADGYLTELIKDQRGNLIRKIQQTYDDGGTGENNEYLVTVYEYYSDDTLKSESIPFEKTGYDNRREDPAGGIVWARQIEYEYHDGTNKLRMETVKDDSGSTISTTVYNIDGRVTETIDALSNTTESAYSDDGKLIETRRRFLDSTGQEKKAVTGYKYEDADGNLTKVVQLDDAGNEVVTSLFTYDSKGRMITSTNGDGGSDGVNDGVKTYFVYDANGNQILSYYHWTDPYDDTDPAEKTIASETSYDAEGRVTGTARYVEDGHQTYTATNGPPSGAKLWFTETDYNDVGLVNWSKDRYGTKTTNVYDVRGLLIETYTEAAYNTSGYPTKFVVTRTEYDSQGRAKYTTDPHEENATGPQGQEVPDNAPSYGTYTKYDGLGRVIETQRKSGMQITIGNYDPPNGYKKVTSSTEGTTISASRTHYDGTGRTDYTLSPGMDTGDLRTEYNYDDAGRLLHSTQDLDGDTETEDDRYTILYYRYDLAGRQTYVTQDADNDGDPDDGYVTQYIYDDLGRVMRTVFLDPGDSSPVVTSTQYDARGRRIAETDAMGNITQYEYYDDGALKAVILPSAEVDNPGGSGTINVSPRYEYGYDEYGNQKSIKDFIYQNGETVRDGHL